MTDDHAAWVGLVTVSHQKGLPGVNEVPPASTTTQALRRVTDSLLDELLDRPARPAPLFPEDS